MFRSESGSSGEDIQGSGSGHRKLLVAAMSTSIYLSSNSNFLSNVQVRVWKFRWWCPRIWIRSQEAGSCYVYACVSKLYCPYLFQPNEQTIWGIWQIYKILNYVHSIWHIVLLMNVLHYHMYFKETFFYSFNIYKKKHVHQFQTSDYSSLTSNSSEYHSSNNDSHGSGIQYLYKCPMANLFI